MANVKEIGKAGERVANTDYLHNLCNMGKIQQYNAKLIDSWCLTKTLEGCSEQTLAGYRAMMLLFAYIMDKKLTLVTTAEIRHFLMEYQQKRGCSYSQIDNIRRYISSFYAYLEDEYYVDSSPAKRVHKIKYAKTLRQPFSEDELVKMEFQAPTKRDKALIAFLSSTGVRVGELIRINIEDLDMKNMELVVLGKGSKERLVYFDTRTKYLINQYLSSRSDNDPALFIIDHEPFSRLTKQGVEYIVRSIGEECGIDKCYPHRFRRTFATRLLNRGMPIEQVQKLLGHSNLNTTLIYAQVSQENVKVSYKKFQ